MPTNLWEPPPHQPDSRNRFRQEQSDEPGNFEPARRENDRERDASAEPERRLGPPYDMNTHVSER
jgi:hypothetical protein